MDRKLVLRAENNRSVWACTACGWIKPLPRLVESGKIQREFVEHDCLKHPLKRRGPNEDVNQAAGPQEISQSPSK